MFHIECIVRTLFKLILLNLFFYHPQSYLDCNLLVRISTLRHLRTLYTVSVRLCFATLICFNKS